jgi:hypothetical protein
MFHPEDTVIRCAGQEIGGNVFTVIAGPCAVESEEQMLEVARSVKEAGAHFLRGGAYKPRSSPYSFQGLGEEGVELLKLARAETGLGLVSEILDALFRRNAELLGDLLGRRAADSVDIGQRDFDALVSGDVDPGNTSHSLPFFSSTGRQSPHLVARKDPSSKRKADARTSAPPDTGGSG